ncbi:hypothetical protein GIB67_005796 [Kingdonia uniflora]|uniref:Uncharacterized protein n=1 Tax=Kingdonia uniflora TaxID=39325 RepID=A0A7J7MBJ3_9MAGN|nr:hypothetical protein GIB67_005796 [Kingdonia uniflora]
MEVEDDVFYADISQRIALLIMDDDEDPTVHCPPVSLQAFTRATMQSPHQLYDQAFRRERSKGTGVFIPRSSLPRRKNRQGRSTSFNTKSNYRQPERSRVVSDVNCRNDPSSKFYSSK